MFLQFISNIYNGVAETVKAASKSFLGDFYLSYIPVSLGICTIGKTGIVLIVKRKLVFFCRLWGLEFPIPCVPFVRIQHANLVM